MDPEREKRLLPDPPQTNNNPPSPNRDSTRSPARRPRSPYNSDRRSPPRRPRSRSPPGRSSGDYRYRDRPRSPYRGGGGARPRSPYRRRSRSPYGRRSRSRSPGERSPRSGSVGFGRDRDFGPRRFPRENNYRPREEQQQQQQRRDRSRTPPRGSAHASRGVTPNSGSRRSSPRSHSDRNVRSPGYGRGGDRSPAGGGGGRHSPAHSRASPRPLPPRSPRRGGSPAWRDRNSGGAYDRDRDSRSHQSSGNAWDKDRDSRSYQSPASGGWQDSPRNPPPSAGWAGHQGPAQQSWDSQRSADLPPTPGSGRPPPTGPAQGRYDNYARDLGSPASTASGHSQPPTGPSGRGGGILSAPTRPRDPRGGFGGLAGRGAPPRPLGSAGLPPTRPSDIGSPVAIPTGPRSAGGPYSAASPPTQPSRALPTGAGHFNAPPTGPAAASSSVAPNFPPQHHQPQHHHPIPPSGPGAANPHRAPPTQPRGAPTGPAAGSGGPPLRYGYGRGGGGMGGPPVLHTASAAASAAAAGPGAASSSSTSPAGLARHGASALAALQLASPVEGGRRAASGLEPAQERRLAQLAEERRRLGDAAEERQRAKRAGLREWERLGRESAAAGLRSELAEGHLSRLSGEVLGGGKY